VYRDKSRYVITVLPSKTLIDALIKDVSRICAVFEIEGAPVDPAALRPAAAAAPAPALPAPQGAAPGGGGCGCGGGGGGGGGGGCGGGAGSASAAGGQAPAGM
jgi:hypothetical protein